MVKNPPTNARDTGDASSIPGWGRSPGVGNGISLQYSCLGNPMATVHGVAKGQAPLSTPTHGIDSRDHSKTKTVQRMGFRWQLPDLLPGFFQKGQLMKTQLFKGPECLSLKGKLTDPLLKQLSYLLVDAGRAGRGKDWLEGPMLRLVLRWGRKEAGNQRLTPPYSNCSPWTKGLAP